MHSCILKSGISIEIYSFYLNMEQKEPEVVFFAYNALTAL